MLIANGEDAGTVLWCPFKGFCRHSSYVKTAANYNITSTSAWIMM